MILIKKSINLNNQQIELNAYLEKDFSVTVVNQKRKILFLKEIAKSYVVDEQERKLIAIPDAMAKLKPLKDELGEVWLDKICKDSSLFREQSYYIANNCINSSLELTGEVAICVDDRLRSTVNYTQNLSESNERLFELELAENETLSYCKTILRINGQKVISEMEVTSMEDAIMPQQFRDFLNYTVSAKAA
ncbi:hypothetical protein [Zobellia barbeyronii]|uniref:Uncharacterized protein n=1 Tax=Zobellia barbeyronii TaxID=2748009 RepID=A0ABS5WJV6_9FLAO|nr:hypothetical protein [Zobellia barbeyronii]MBT2163469.1 hypothetical protein [Zobellia barbeyronii]